MSLRDMAAIVMYGEKTTFVFQCSIFHPALQQQQHMSVPLSRGQPLIIPPWCAACVWQMRARRCAAPPLTCRVVVWARWASSYGRYVTRLWAPGTTSSLWSSASSSSPLAPCRPGWWASSWCSTSATSRRKASSSIRRTRRSPPTRVAACEPGVTMATGIWKRHKLSEMSHPHTPHPSPPLSPSLIPTVPPVNFQDCHEVQLDCGPTESV